MSLSHYIKKGRMFRKIHRIKKQRLQIKADKKEIVILSRDKKNEASTSRVRKEKEVQNES